MQRAGKILMNLMSGAAEEARTRNMETVLRIIQEKLQQNHQKEQTCKLQDAQAEKLRKKC